ncbi:MAG: (E)-4-hydroxy-3-methylbut-2-enyl-diphosphate synthase [Synergistaceae bacterium]|nr:(E)-4-hydroxy-3-methylbut-2-enyl-diphosphate synthase [Synergistaceae bacterium]
MSQRSVSVGSLGIGGSNPVRVESMLKSPLDNLMACREELRGLASAGCEMVRVAFSDPSKADALAELVSEAEIPLMADIHFNPDLAVLSLKAGVPAIRINPGNMGSPMRLAEILHLARERRAVIRIGANGGSLSDAQLAESGGDRSLALVGAVEAQLKYLLEHGFEDVILSAKSTSIPETVRANALLAERYPYPLHIGITEAGPGLGGIVKNAAGIGILLNQGIGDTIRVSLTAPAEQEVETGYAILNALGIRRKGFDLISCPTCGRKRIDVQALVQRILPALSGLPDGFSVAVMGCEVNGPREAAHADLGISGSPNGFILFSHGRRIAVAGAGNLEDILRETLEKICPKKN